MKIRLTPTHIYFLIGHGFFIAFTLGCFIYFKERLLNNDAAYYTFHVVNYETFFVKHERYISYLTQWAPILLAKMGVSLKSVLISYSIIFAIWFYGLYGLVAHIWKSPREALLLVFSLCLTMRFKHFAGHTEITFALIVAATLVAWILLDKSKLKWYKNRYDWTIKLIFIAWLYIIHPIVIVPLAIVLGIDLIVSKRWKSSNHFLFLIFLFSSFILRFITVAKDSYESGKISILSTAEEVFSNPDEFYVFHIVKRYFDKEYHLVFGLFIISIIILVYRKKIIAALGLISGNLILLGLIIVTYSYLRGDLYLMIDGYLGMLGMVVGYGFYLASKEIQRELVFSGLLLLIVVFCLVRINSKAKFMNQRLEWYQETFDMYPGESKLFALLVLHDWDLLWYPYEIPVETLMLTAIEGKENSKTIFIDYHQKNMLEKYPEPDGFYFFDSNMAIEKLNPKFFDLPNDHPYIKIDKVAWE